MSDLLIILVVLGALILLGVLLFNWWQEKSFRSRIAHDFKPSKRDVLIEDFQSNTDQLAQERIKSSSSKLFEPLIERPAEHNISQRKEPVFNEVTQKNRDANSTEPALAVPNHLPISNEEISTSEQVMEELPIEDTYAQDLAGLDDMQNTPVARHPVYVRDQLSMPNALHPQIDLIALLYASIPIAQTKVIGLDTPFNEFSERTFAFGLTTENEWLAMSESQPQHTFTQLAYSLQLADRGGPVTRSILNRFQHMVETIGLDLSAHVEWQGAGDPLNHALSLDQFCIEVDKTVGFHLLANNSTSFHATKLRGLVEAQGLSLHDDGRFHHHQAVPPHQLEFAIRNFEGNAFTPSMLKSSVMHGVTFQLDIPTVKNSLDVFDNMTNIAKSIAKSLDASIVDDNKKVLGDIQLEKIRQQLKVINATMIAKGIIPGSPHALRLFS